MSIINKKVCMIGDFSVGKTSLIARFVRNIFSDKYLSTVGVKIDSKEIQLDSQLVIKLMIWDLAGKDTFSELDNNYLKGSSGYMLVADGTRRETINNALTLQQHIEEVLGPLPLCMLINKHDLKSDWQLTSSEKEIIDSKEWPHFLTSAKDGENVEDAFRTLARMLVS